MMLQKHYVIVHSTCNHCLNTYNLLLVSYLLKRSEQDKRNNKKKCAFNI